MLFNVPQFIDIEDKIIGPLTGKQLGWLGIGGVLIIIGWNVLDRSAFFVAAIFISAIFGGLAFYRPYNQPLIKFITSSIHFMFRPKIYVWRRNYDNIKPVRRAAVKKTEAIQPRKILNREKIGEITKILDRNN
jgi:hypothetical protein